MPVVVKQPPRSELLRGFPYQFQDEQRDCAAGEGQHRKFRSQGLRGLHVPLIGPRQDDGKCALCPLYPRPARRFPRRVGGCRHRSSQTRPRLKARVPQTLRWIVPIHLTHTRRYVTDVAPRSCEVIGEAQWRIIFEKLSHVQPTRTAKERLGPKANDEQRVDNCKVPLDRRGPKPRPAATTAQARVGTNDHGTHA